MVQRVEAQNQSGEMYQEYTQNISNENSKVYKNKYQEYTKNISKYIQDIPDIQNKYNIPRPGRAGPALVFCMYLVYLASLVYLVFLEYIWIYVWYILGIFFCIFWNFR